MNLIDAAFDRSRMVMFGFIIILLSGMLAYLAIPKESEPDIPIPFFYVSMGYEGISPEDAERLLVKPMEKELKSIEGIKAMTSVAAEGHASVTLEFSAGFDAEQALLDIREKVDNAKAELPPETDEPRITEINVALFPVLTIALSGPVSERQLVTLANYLQDEIESLPDVLEAKISGDRDEMLEVVLQPDVMESYDITFQDIAAILRNNNQLVAAGALDNGAGRMVLKVPGVLEDSEDILNLPIKVSKDSVITFQDVVSLRRIYKDPQGFARVQGDKAVLIEISKRVGANIIETIDSVREVVEANRDRWPAAVQITYMQDKSTQIDDLLGELENNILSAIVLVMIVIIAALGMRPALLVGLSIPGSFLAGILLIYSFGYTINMVVLFSLILVVGMLVDGAIVTTELADRKIAEGLNRHDAFLYAAKRMSWPITAATATTLAVFAPLLFWPGIVGEFMKYLPITVLLTLVCSLLMALICIPVLGSFIGNRQVSDPETLAMVRQAEDGDLNQIKGLTGAYLRLLTIMLRHPLKVLLSCVALLITTYATYISLGKGVEFFPEVEPEFIQVQVQARGDLSIREKDELLRRVEAELLPRDEFKTIYSRTFASASNERNMPADAIGVIQIEFIDWQIRKPAAEIIEQLRQQLAHIPGIKVQVRKQESGPSGGKPVKIELSSLDYLQLNQAVEYLYDLMHQQGGFVDIEDNRALPGIEWQLEIDRKQAALYGADVVTLGNTVQLITTGLKLTEYQPDDVDEELDIRLRYPANERSMEQLMQMKVATAQGHIPISNFVEIRPAEKTGDIIRVDGHRTLTVQADVAEGRLVDDQVSGLKELAAVHAPPTGVSVRFKGEDQDQKEAGIFLMKAFFIALFLMTTILLTQFNSFYQTLLVMSAIVFSTAGVLLGLLITGNPFGIVMCGIGIIALAGIVVNNNIVLIDTFNQMKYSGIPIQEAVMRTAAQRMRPVLLTAVTTVLGLLPMVFALNIDLIHAQIMVGAPSSQWWIQLSSTIAGGLTFATLLTLLLTPCMLILGERFHKKRRIYA